MMFIAMVSEPRASLSVARRHPRAPPVFGTLAQQRTALLEARRLRSKALVKGTDCETS